jgi:hypothetical protein
MTVMCQRYRVTEEEKLGGYCVFDMEFVEFGKPPLAGPPMSDAQLKAQSDALKARTIQALANYDTELLGRKTTPTPAGPSVPISEIIPIGPTIPGPGP